jgi:hypothetical protein
MTSLLRSFLDETIAALAPLVAAAQDEPTMLALLSELGWTPSSIPRPLADLAAAGADLANFVGAGDDSDDADLFAAIGKLVDAIGTIHSEGDGAFPSGVDVQTFKSTIGHDLLDYLLVEHLLTNRHRIGGPL